MRKSLYRTLSLLTLIALYSVASATVANLRPATSSSTASAAGGNVTLLPSKSNRLAEDMEESLLKAGHYVRVKAQGKDGRTLTVIWLQMGAQFVYKFASDDRLIKKLQSAGFSHIHFENGDRFWDQQIE